jgi:hypothetical protein
MAASKGIDRHPIFKLGKAPAKRDARNLKFAAILKAPVTLPKEYDFDLKHPGIPTPMFANDRYGDCVIAGRAHQTLRFELIEQKKKLQVTDKDVLREYMKETGGADTGLVVLDSLKLWRKPGWNAAKRKYSIKAFSELNRANHNQVKQAIVLNIGVGLGLSLPISAQGQFQSGKPWDVVSGPNGRPNSWGGHYVLVPGYTTRGPVCVTWGTKHQMTWAFFDKYCDEAYAIIDAIDTPKKKKALDSKALAAFLGAL